DHETTTRDRTGREPSLRIVLAGSPLPDQRNERRSPAPKTRGGRRRKESSRGFRLAGSSPGTFALRKTPRGTGLQSPRALRARHRALSPCEERLEERVSNPPRASRA